MENDLVRDLRKATAGRGRFNDFGKHDFVLAVGISSARDITALRPYGR